MPWERGFERSLNSPGRRLLLRRRRSERELFLNGKALANDDAARCRKNWYTTDLWTDYGIKFIDEALAAKKPFFLYLAHNAPHFPLQAPQDEIAKFRGKYKIGWDKLREQRHARQIELGVVDKAWPLSPRPPEVQAWDRVDAGRSRTASITSWPSTRRCVAHMDTAVGRLVDGAQAARRARQHADPLPVRQRRQRRERPRRPARGRSARRGRLDGLLRAVVGDAREHAVAPLQAFQPRRRHRHAADRPLAGAASRRPANCAQQPGHLVDIMATCVDVAGAKYPAEFQGQADPADGRQEPGARPSTNQPIERDALFWEHEGNAAIRVGDWKLVRLGRNGPWELYNLQDRPHRAARPGRRRAGAGPASWPPSGMPGPSGRT